ncbi:MAG: OmpA family protein [Gammaproteobacteria bacterium]|nr:OmpA family protein [Gammaproteobacteria bacterium]
MNVRLNTLLAVILMSLILGGCSPLPPLDGPAKPAKPAKPTQAQLRQHYLNRLHAEGVQTIRLGQSYRLIFPSDQVFVSRTDRLITAVKPALNNAARLIKTYKTVAINVNAYSDNITLNGAPKARKQALTAAQAQAVSAYLWSRGIDTRLLTAHGLGDKNAVAWNGSKRGRYFNRRVEVSFRFYPATHLYNVE